jgi:hypothetical protein
MGLKFFLLLKSNFNKIFLFMTTFHKKYLLSIKLLMKSTFNNQIFNKI